MVFISENSIVAAGHDYEPILFTGDANSGWTVSKSLDDPSSRSNAATASRGSVGGVGRLNNEAFNRFKLADRHGVSNVSAGGGGALGTGSIKGGDRNTAHQNTITSVRAYEGQHTPEVSKISTSGLDGRVVIWNTGGLSSGMAKMSI